MGLLQRTILPDDVVASGIFAINSYNAVFKIEEDVIDTVVVVYGQPVVAPEAPEKEGHTFAGWQDVPQAMPAKDIVIVGSYTVNSYKLTYNVDGETYKEYTIDYGTTITPEAFPEKEGHSFSGWEGLPETMPAYDISIEGTFNVNNYTVTYIIDGEVYETATVEYGAEIELPSVPEKEGYTFSGWENVPETMPAKDIVIQGNYIVDTAVEEIYLDLGNIEVYNLKGLRITETEKLTRGIYIINGKKTFVK